MEVSPVNLFCVTVKETNCRRNIYLVKCSCHSDAIEKALHHANVDELVVASISIDWVVADAPSAYCVEVHLVG
jgi:hypothetical protein